MRHGRGRPAAPAITVVTLLVAVTGCGGDAGGDAKSGREEAGSAAPPTGPPPLTEARLTAVALGEGERVGKYTATEFPLGTSLDAEYTARPAACQPLVSLARGATSFTPAAEVGRQVDDPDEMLGLTVGVHLRSYAGQGAAGVMKAIHDAGRICANGFGEDRGLVQATYIEVEPVKAPALGAEAVAYRFTILDVKGKLKLYEYLTVVRSGSSTLSFRAEITGTEDIGAVPAEVIQAQWAKFEAS